MVSQGKISAKDMVDAFDSMTSAGGRFADLMEAQSQTLSGQWSNLQDTLANRASRYTDVYRYGTNCSDYMRGAK